MVNTCVVAGCSKAATHRFPQDPDLCMKWRVAINRQGENKGLWKPSRHSYICGDHFRAEDFQPYIDKVGRRHLEPDAVPSLLLCSSRVKTALPNERSLRLSRRSAKSVRNDPEANESMEQAGSDSERETIAMSYISKKNREPLDIHHTSPKVPHIQSLNEVKEQEIIPDRAESTYFPEKTMLADVRTIESVSPLDSSIVYMDKDIEVASWETVPDLPKKPDAGPDPPISGLKEVNNVLLILLRR